MSTNLSQAQSAQQGNRTTDGKYTFGTHAEPDGLMLSSQLNDLDQMVVASLEGLVQAEAQRQIERDRSASSSRYDFDGYLSQASRLRELQERAKDFATLPIEHQKNVLEGLRMKGAVHLLEPGQKLGNDVVTVTDGLEESLSDEQTFNALVAQKEIERLGLKVPVELRKSQHTSEPVFAIKRKGIEQEMRYSSGRYLALDAVEDGSLADSDVRYEWYDRGYTSASLPGFGKVDENNWRTMQQIDKHLEYSVIMDEAFKTPGLKNHPETFGEWDLQTRSLDLNTGEGTYNITFAGNDNLIMSTENGDELHPSMIKGFLSHIAEEIEHEGGGDGLEADVRDVFDRAGQRLNDPDQ